MEDLRRVAEIIKERANVVAFTGAGISVESGIPTFRGAQGLWERYDPDEYAHISSFMRHPEKVWMMLREMAQVIFDAKPSPAHEALSELERMGYLRAIITQNVDGLHHLAGNKNVIEYHGNHRWLVCPSCKYKTEFTRDVLSIFPYPRCARCERALKPDVVFFGESIPFDAMIRANEEARSCRVMFVIGTSGVVYPAAEIPFISKSHGAVIVEINIERTPFTRSITDFFFAGSASYYLPELIKFLK
ncbi:MAG: NAD-dependent deacylase [Desulfobacterota bacterium]|nr:NAD-dependent deacylase [Thermodesulfobacteriota bacterium]MDW8001712.1 NAD-dependent deacylase [Deltaproteobacteria bacterium]